MRRLSAVATASGGAILEVGFGMGLSAREIQTAAITSHTILECHPDVLERCLAEHRGAIAEGAIRLITGFWQDTTPLLASCSFDGILFDTYPVESGEDIGPHMWFFEEAHRLLKPGGVLTYYSNEVEVLSEFHMGRLGDAGFDQSGIGWEVFPVSPPAGCEYWSDATIVVPIVRKALT